MKRPKPKPMKPFKAWAVISDATGEVCTESHSDSSLAVFRKRLLKQELFEGESLVRVELRKAGSEGA